MRHDPHFDLRVIRAHEIRIRLLRNKPTTNPQAVGATRRDILQIRFRRGQTPRRCSGLRKSRMDTLVDTNARNQTIDHLLELDAVTMDK